MRNLVIRAVILFWAGGVLATTEQKLNQKLNISKMHAIIPLVGAAAAAILATSLGPNEASSVISVDKTSMDGTKRSGDVLTLQQLSGLIDSPSVLKRNTDSSDMTVQNGIFATPEEEAESELNTKILSQGWGAYEPVLKAYFAAMAGKEVNEKIAYLESEIRKSSEKPDDDVSILKNAVARTIIDELKTDQVVRRNELTRWYLDKTKDIKSPTQKFNYYKEQVRLVKLKPDSNEERVVLSQLMTAEQNKVARVRDDYFYQRKGPRYFRIPINGEHAGALWKWLTYSYLFSPNNYANELDREGLRAAIDLLNDKKESGILTSL